MGFSAWLKSNRANQLQVLAQLLLVYYVLKTYTLKPPASSSSDSATATPNVLKSPTRQRGQRFTFLSPDSTPRPSHNTNSSRSPEPPAVSANQPIPATRETSSTASNKLLYLRNRAYNKLVSANSKLLRYEPWQLIVGALATVHLINNWSLLLGMSPPQSSLITQPDMNYSPSFQRARYFLTAFDAAVLSTLRLRPAPLRHVASYLLLFWYLVFSKRAEHKVEAFRRALSVRYIRAMWEKGGHPILSALNSLIAPKKPIVYMHPITINNVPCYLFYNKLLSELQNETELILDFPGGGFVSMSVSHHADYLSHIAKQLNVPLLSVQYRKAPEHPYPHGLNDCYNVYKQVIQSNGECLGIHSNVYKSYDAKDNRLKVVLLGDSAGGNLAAAVTLKALAYGVRPPNGVNMIYPSLDMSTEIWKTAYQQKQQQQNDGGIDTKVSDNAVTAATQISKADATSSQPTQTVAADTGRIPEAVKPFNPFGPELAFQDNPNRPQLTSKALYAFDGVLPMRYMLLIGQALFRNGGDPVGDWFASPLRAPKEVLKHFPPVYIHAGSVDPLSDDSVFFIDRIKQANPQADTKVHLIPGVSHAYMQITALLPEGKQALQLSCGWLRELLSKPTREPIHIDKLELPAPVSGDDCSHDSALAQGAECATGRASSAGSAAIDRVVGHADIQSESNSVGDKQRSSDNQRMTSRL